MLYVCIVGTGCSYTLKMSMKIHLFSEFFLYSSWNSSCFCFIFYFERRLSWQDWGGTLFWLCLSCGDQNVISGKQRGCSWSMNCFYIFACAHFYIGSQPINTVRCEKRKKKKKKKGTTEHINFIFPFHLLRWVKAEDLTSCRRNVQKTELKDDCQSQCHE